jgi:hypothetical protein
VVLGANEAFAGIGFGLEDTQISLWEGQGLEMLMAVTESIEFHPVEADADSGISPCTVTTDETYGYSPENAVRVGGEAFGGPERE